MNKKRKQKTRIKRPKKQKNTLYNIEMLYKARNNVTEFFDDYSLMVSEAKHKASKIEQGLKYQLLNKCFKDYQ